jgi:hypothetical protein
VSHTLVSILLPPAVSGIQQVLDRETATGSLTAVAASLGVGSAGVILGSLVQTYLSRRFLAKSVDGEEFERLLEGGSLEQVGDYLYGRLGSLSVSQFASSPTQWKRVAQLVERAEAVLAEPETGGDKALADYERVQTDAPIVESLARARQLLDQGDLWNSMGELRRQVESVLRRLVPQEATRQRAGAGRLLREAVARSKIDEDIGRHLSQALEVANRGVHGRDVTVPDAYQALVLASRALEAISRDRP